jgi:hypothetical protein
METEFTDTHIGGFLCHEVQEVRKLPKSSAGEDSIFPFAIGTYFYKSFCLFTHFAKGTPRCQESEDILTEWPSDIEEISLQFCKFSPVSVNANTRQLRLQNSSFAPTYSTNGASFAWFRQSRDL